jgi:hypothetical protein
MPNVQNVLLAAEGGGHRELPAEPWVFGLTAFAVLCILLLVTLSFGKDR